MARKLHQYKLCASLDVQKSRLLASQEALEVHLQIIGVERERERDEAVPSPMAAMPQESCELAGLLPWTLSARLSPTVEVRQAHCDKTVKIDGLENAVLERVTAEKNAEVKAERKKSDAFKAFQAFRKRQAKRGKK